MSAPVQGPGGLSGAWSRWGQPAVPWNPQQAAPAAPPAWSGWDRLKAAYTGVGPGGQMSSQSIGRQEQATGGLNQLVGGLSQLASQPITALPQLNTPGTSLGANHGVGMQALVNQLLARR